MLLLGGEGRGGGEFGGQSAEAGSEGDYAVGDRGQRVLVVVAREVVPRDRHQTLCRHLRWQDWRATGTSSPAVGGGDVGGEEGRGEGREVEGSSSL